MADELFQDRGEERKELDSNQNGLGLNPLQARNELHQPSYIPLLFPPSLYTSGSE